MGDAGNRIIAADNRCRSWREKLDLVRGLFAAGQPLDIEDLVDVAIYLRFLGTGQIRCDEDGRHFRPTHHARIAQEIQERLAQIALAEAPWIARRIYPSLPSSAPTFLRAEPLTRIRDIAHRNDIPHELKTEIKTTLQNKLHRCAGPEDLETSAALLGRIAAPGANYSPDFVQQFRIFHDELKEFFNARSLDEQLTALVPKVGDEDARLIHDFQTYRSGAALEQNVKTFELLTRLRTRFLDACKAQRTPNLDLLQADIALEDFAFALASTVSNVLQTDSSPTPWKAIVQVLGLTVRNLRLSDIRVDECQAIESELHAWLEGFQPEDREHLLRIKATADRARRVAEEFSDRLAGLFMPRVESLGRALGVEDRAIRVFGDAEIRGHLAFQLSKLVGDLMRRLRHTLKLPAWDVIVSGRATGLLDWAPSLAELPGERAQPALLLLQHAEGDEEIPEGIAGIVLAHDLPHLSHLGVRARQAGVLLVACEERTQFDKLRQWCGQSVTLVASPDHFEVARGGKSPAPSHRPRGNAAIPAVELSPKSMLLPIEQASLTNCGGKAHGMKCLTGLAKDPAAGFRTPPAWVVPFGVVELALQSAPASDHEYRQLLSRSNDVPIEELAAVAEKMRDIVLRTPVPAAVDAQIREKCAQTGRLMVRSSANCEDLEQLAGAGLYDSVANVPLMDVEAAIRKVWASLWPRRAALSRRQAGIPQDQAHMAVLIQPMLRPDLSFVLHTTHPISGNANEVYAEIAVGLGEILASAGERGSACRLTCDKSSVQVTTLAFASFSRALWPGEQGQVAPKTIDYSSVRLSCDSAFRRSLGNRLCKVARFVAEALGKPQDIEGVLVQDDLFLVQSRPQQGLRPAHNS